MGQVIQFPTNRQAERPFFAHWLTEEVGGKWCVVKQRRTTWKGMPNTRIQLLSREYLAYQARYEAMYGPVYA